MVVPPKHPKMIIFGRKTHGCWVPPFRGNTHIYQDLQLDPQWSLPCVATLSVFAGFVKHRESSMMMLAQRRVPVLIAQYRGDVVLEFQMTDTRCVESVCGQLHHGIMILIIHAQAIWGVNRCLSSSSSSSSSAAQPNHQWFHKQTHHHSGQCPGQSHWIHGDSQGRRSLNS